MARFVRRVTVVDLSGQQAPSTIYKSKRKKRRISGWLKPFERHDRRMARAAKAFGDEIHGRHRRSNGKRKNGWLRDGNVNLFKAHRKAIKKITKR